MEFSKYIQVCLLIGLLLLTVSCSNDSDRIAYEYLTLETMAKQECSATGRDYTQHFTRDGKTWVVLCHTKSPYTSIEYGLKK